MSIEIYLPKKHSENSSSSKTSSEIVSVPNLFTLFISSLFSLWFLLNIVLFLFEVLLIYNIIYYINILLKNDNLIYYFDLNS